MCLDFRPGIDGPVFAVDGLADVADVFEVGLIFANGAGEEAGENQA